MSAKNLDRQGRWRSKVVAFRVSPEEDELLEAKVALSGLTKQDYITRRLLDQEVVVIGNPRVYKALRDQMLKIEQMLGSLTKDDDIPADLIELMQFMANIMNGMKDET